MKTDKFESNRSNCYGNSEIINIVSTRYNSDALTRLILEDEEERRVKPIAEIIIWDMVTIIFQFSARASTSISGEGTDYYIGFCTLWWRPLTIHARDVDMPPTARNIALSWRAEAVNDYLLPPFRLLVSSGIARWQTIEIIGSLAALNMCMLKRTCPKNEYRRSAISKYFEIAFADVNTFFWLCKDTWRGF